MFTKTLLATSVGCVLSLALAAQATADTIGFDFDQDGDFDSVEALDWAPGNALAVGAVPLAIGDTFTTHVQGELTSVTLSGGASVATPIGAAGPYEITYVIELEESVAFAADADGDGVPDLVNFNHTGGSVSLYWDDFTGGTVNADALSPLANSGLGYDDGTLILSADVIPTLLGAAFSITGGSFLAVPEDLDQFGVDNLGGIQTLPGSGDADVDATVTFQNAGWFSGGIALIEFLLNATLENPFNANNPELLVGGVAPFYGANGINGVYADGEPEDFHFEADGNSSFVAEAVPEPGSVALLGLGLSMLGAGQLRRRRRNQA